MGVAFGKKNPPSEGFALDQYVQVALNIKALECALEHSNHASGMQARTEHCPALFFLIVTLDAPYH